MRLRSFGKPLIQNSVGVRDPFHSRDHRDEGRIPVRRKLENRSNYSIEHVAYPCISDLQRPAGAGRFLRKNWKYAEMAEVELYPHFRNEYGYWSNEFAFQRVGNPESAFVLMEDGSQGLYAGAMTRISLTACNFSMS